MTKATAACCKHHSARLDAEYRLNCLRLTPDNLFRSATAALQDSGARDKAKTLAGDILEYSARIDFDKYFDAQAGRGGGGLGGRRQQEFVDFSASSVKATQVQCCGMAAT